MSLAKQFEAVAARIRSMPEVTKEEAALYAVTLCAQLNSPVPTTVRRAIESLCQVTGFAATCDDPELVRRFIVLQCQEGPL